jgi:gluconolactonase
MVAPDVPGVGLVFSEPDASRILVLDNTNHVSTLVEQSNETHGMTWDSNGRLVSAQSRSGQTRIGVVYPRSREAVIADNFEGKPFSRPNDVIVDKKGGVYFTDPGLNGAQAEALRKAQGGKPPAPRLPPAVYYIPAGGRAITMSCGGLDCQGLAFGGADKRTLYVAGHGSLFKIGMLATGFKGRAK